MAIDLRKLIGLFLVVSLPTFVYGQPPDPPVSIGSRRSSTYANGSTNDTPKNVLSATDWRRVDQSVDRALTFLAAQQQPDGCFPSTPNAQPGVTSLCVLAFMAHGHTPGHGPYGDRLDRAVKYILDCQKKAASSCFWVMMSRTSIATSNTRSAQRAPTITPSHPLHFANCTA
ncbi:MAG TPA: hypothetical protein VFW73_02470 [Lacipirellulaceae bacterium]|nr:hypothetical protein [Lacipirellulaceae bacterium]